MACWYFKSASHTTTSAEGVCRGKRPSDSLEVIGPVKGSRGSNRRLLPTGRFLRHCSAYDTPCSGRRVLQSVRINTLPEFNAHDTLGSRSCDRSRVTRHAAEPGREPGRPGFRVSEASIFFFTLQFNSMWRLLRAATRMSQVALCWKPGLLPHCLCVPRAANTQGLDIQF